MPISNKVINGVKIGEITVDTAVKETDNATSPLERNVMTSEAVPPGTVPTKISPTVKASFKEKTLARRNAIIGIITYCAEIPTVISFGFLNTLTKSPNFKVVPIVKRTIPKSKFNIFMPLKLPKTHRNAFG